MKQPAASFWIIAACCCASLFLLLPRVSAADNVERLEREKTIVAVFAIQTHRVRIDRTARSMFHEYLHACLAESGRFRTVPDDLLRRRLVRQRRRSYRSCVKRSCQIEIGRELAAQKTLTPRILRFGRECIVTLTLFDLEQAVADRGVTVRGRCSQRAIAASIAAATDKLAGGGAGSSSSRSSATARYQRGCHHGQAAACRALGWLYQVGAGVRRDPKQAAALYWRACERGDGLACSNLGYLHAGGRGVSHDARVAATYYRLACTAGSAIGCNNLADMLRRGSGVPRDRQRAAALFRRACKAGFAPACDDL